jgi:lipid-binding SYLF domain-containing protein
MRLQAISRLGFSLVFALAASLAALAQGQPDKSRMKGDMKDEIEQSQKAAKVFTEIMNAPDKGIPQNIIDGAECVAVFPEVIKAGFIIGGRGGRGVASCRVGNTWSAPVYFNIGGGSFGAQIGVESTDFVLLFMNKDGVNTLLKNKFEVGGEASVSAGPVGRTAAASTDAALNAQILSYSRSKGLFAGVMLKGAVIEIDEDDMRDAYGRETSARLILQENKVNAPAGIRAFPDTLAKHSTRKAEKAAK